MSGPQDSSSPFVPFVADMAMAGFSAGITTTIVAPLTRVLHILQAQQSSKQLSPAQRYRGSFDAFRRIPKEQGILSFWRGNMIKVVRFFPTYMLNFALADKCKALFPMYNPDTDFWKFFASNMASGSLAAATTLLFVYPLDLVYTRMALDVGKGATREFSGLRSCFSAVFKTGLGSFYHGYEVSIAGAIVYRAAYFGIYDTMRQLCFGDSDTCNYFNLWLLAQGVTTAAMLLTYPFYTISANLMMQAGRSDTLYTGTLDCIRKMYAGGGVRAFYGGGLLRFASTVGGAFMMVVYDVIRNTYFS